MSPNEQSSNLFNGLHYHLTFAGGPNITCYKVNLITD